MRINIIALHESDYSLDGGLSYALKLFSEVSMFGITLLVRISSEGRAFIIDPCVLEKSVDSTLHGLWKHGLYIGKDEIETSNNFFWGTIDIDECADIIRSVIFVGQPPKDLIVTRLRNMNIDMVVCNYHKNSNIAGYEFSEKQIEKKYCVKLLVIGDYEEIIIDFIKKITSVEIHIYDIRKIKFDLDPKYSNIHLGDWSKIDDNAASIVWDFIFINNYIQNPEFASMKLCGSEIISKNQFIRGLYPSLFDMSNIDKNLGDEISLKNINNSESLFRLRGDDPINNYFFVRQIDRYQTNIKLSSYSFDILNDIRRISLIRSKRQMLIWAITNLHNLAETEYSENIVRFHDRLRINDYDFHKIMQYIDLFCNLMKSKGDKFIGDAYVSLLKRPFERERPASIEGLSKRIAFIETIVNSKEFSLNNDEIVRAAACEAIRLIVSAVPRYKMDRLIEIYKHKHVSQIEKSDIINVKYSLKEAIFYFMYNFYIDSENRAAVP